MPNYYLQNKLNHYWLIRAQSGELVEMKYKCRTDYFTERECDIIDPGNEYERVIADE